MTVEDLRDTLTHLVGLLRASDAKAATLRDLEAFVASAAAFDGLSLKEFVRLAELGRSPPEPRPSRGRATAAAGPAPDVLVKAVTDLYAGAAGSDLTEEQVAQTTDALLPLTKADILKAADAVRLSGMKSKSKGDIVTAVKNAILDRRRAALRTQLSQPTPATSEG